MDGSRIFRIREDFFDFCNDEIFDVEKSASSVGVLTEFFRKEAGVVRTVHPIFSFAIKGGACKLFSSIDMDSFGKKSVFETLRANNGMIIFLGAPFSSFTFLHYIEQEHGVPYRYLKKFNGTIKEKDQVREESCTFFVRRIDDDVETNTSYFEKRLRQSGSLRSAKVGTGEVLGIRAEDAYREGMRMLDEDIYSFLLHPPKSIIDTHQ